MVLKSDKSYFEVIHPSTENIVFNLYPVCLAERSVPIITGECFLLERRQMCSDPKTSILVTLLLKRLPSQIGLIPFSRRVMCLDQQLTSNKSVPIWSRQILDRAKCYTTIRFLSHFKSLPAFSRRSSGSTTEFVVFIVIIIR